MYHYVFSGDFNLVGTAVPRRQSANDKERQQEQSILQNLRQEGLIQRPVSRAQGGLRFDVVEDNKISMLPLRPPMRLAKLEKRQKKHKRTLTNEDIEAKLIKAQERKRVCYMHMHQLYILCIIHNLPCKSIYLYQLIAVQIDCRNWKISDYIVFNQSQTKVM